MTEHAGGNVRFLNHQLSYQGRRPRRVGRRLHHDGVARGESRRDLRQIYLHRIIPGGDRSDHSHRLAHHRAEAVDSDTTLGISAFMDIVYGSVSSQGGDVVESWLGQYCIFVTDLEVTIKFYETLGLECTSRTEIPDINEAILENPDKGGKLQIAQHTKRTGPLQMGNAFWKLYVATNDIERMYKAAIDAGHSSVYEPRREERWPMTVGFIKDPDGYLVELTQRHPWGEDDSTYAWLNQYCVNVTDLEQTIEFYETLGLSCTSRTEIPGAREAILENPSKGGKIQLAQHDDRSGPIDMGTSMWKLYLHTDDCESVYDAAMAAGYKSVTAPIRLERWPTTIAFVEDPDGYQVEFVQRHPD
jgi:lactoylglutathione lyase